MFSLWERTPGATMNALKTGELYQFGDVKLLSNNSFFERSDPLSSKCDTSLWGLHDDNLNRLSWFSSDFVAYLQLFSHSKSVPPFDLLLQKYYYFNSISTRVMPRPFSPSLPIGYLQKVHEHCCRCPMEGWKRREEAFPFPYQTFHPYPFPCVWLCVWQWEMLSGLFCAANSTQPNNKNPAA